MNLIDSIGSTARAVVDTVADTGTAIAGAVTAQFSPAQQATPTVQERLDAVRTVVEDYGGDVGHAIAETMADPALTEAERDQFMAGIVAMAGGQGISGEDAARMRESLNTLGMRAGTPGLAEAQQSLDRLVNAGTIDAADLGALFDPASNGPNLGVRELLTGITDGRVLNRVANDLLVTAQASNGLASGASFADRSAYTLALLSAADVANMAAANGSPGASRGVLAELERAINAPVPNGEVSIVQQMLFNDTGAIELMGDRSAIATLATLLNSATAPAGTTEATRNRADLLFATLLRDASRMGLGMNGLLTVIGPDTTNVTGALDQLGTYFEANTERLIERDWGYSNSGSRYEGLARDFLENVFLNPAYTQRDRTSQALGQTIDALNATIIDGNAPLHDRTDAARALGTLLGSLTQAGQNFVAESRLPAERQAAILGGAVDLIFRTAIRAGGMPSPAQPGSEALARAIIGAFTDAHVRGAEAAANGEVDAASGATLGAIREYRAALFENLPDNVRGAILDAFDFRAGMRDTP